MKKDKKEKRYRIYRYIRDTLFYFLKNFFYKDNQPQIGKEIRTSLKTCPASNIEKTKNTYKYSKNNE